MADFEMRNFNYFPIEKSSYDLKLDLLEELDPKEALELMKANSGFRSIYLKDPWRIFGRHVHSIRFLYEKIEVCKLTKTAPLYCDSHHLPFLKKIKSCVNFVYERRTQESIDAARKILSNLDSIGKWWYFEDFQECFSNFKGQVTDRIRLRLDWYSGEDEDPNVAIVSKVLETQLGRCKSVVVDCCVDQFSMICKLFSKTWVKRIECQFGSKSRFSMTGVEKAICWLFCNGIPSQNQEASISMHFSTSVATHGFLNNFGSAFPEMQRLPDERDMRRYLRKIDGEGDIVFEWTTSSYGVFYFYFEAKYMPSQAQ